MLDVDPDPAAGRPVPAGVLDQVARAPARARAGRRAPRPARRRRRCPAPRPRSRELVESTSCLGAPARRLLAREREQVVGEPCEPLGVGLEVGDQVGRRAVAGEVRDVAPQRSQRRAQLVRGVGEEAPLGLARPLEALEHRVERRREPADLVVACGLRAGAGAGRRCVRSRPRRATSRTSGRSAPRISSATASAPTSAAPRARRAA